MTTRAATQKSKRATTKTAARKPAARRTSRAKSKADQAHVIQLEGNLGIAQAESLHEELNQTLASHGEMVLDAENLAQVDASIVQLVHAFIRDAEKGAVPVKWKSVPEELRQTADMMGMAEGMGFDA